MIQVGTNLAQGTLASGYTAGATSLTLGTGQGALFPATGDFILAIDDPPAFFLQCTARASDTLTVDTAAVEGTTAANAASGVKVTQVISAGALTALLTQASLATGVRTNPLASAPDLAVPLTGWSKVNGVLLSDFSSHLGVYIQDGNGSVDWRMITQPLPSPPYTVITQLDCFPCFPAQNSQTAGLYLYDGTKMEGIEFVFQNTSFFYSLRIQTMNSVTSPNSTPFGPSVTPLPIMGAAFKIFDDGTHRTYYTFENGTWTQFFQEATNTFLTPTAVGVGGLSIASQNAAVSLVVKHFSIS